MYIYNIIYLNLINNDNNNDEKEIINKTKKIIQFLSFENLLKCIFKLRIYEKRKCYQHLKRNLERT